MVRISDGVFFCVPFSPFFCSSVRICTMMIDVSSEQSRSQFYMHTECCCCCSVCCYTAVVAAAAVMLLPAAVRHRVPDGQIWCWFIESDPSVFFLFIQTLFIFDGTPWQYSVSSRFACILGNYGHARSQGGRQPTTARPPCI